MGTDLAQRMYSAQYRLAEHYLEKLQTAQKAYQQGSERAAQALVMFDRVREQAKQWQSWASARANQDEKAAALCSAYAGASPAIYKLRLSSGEYLSWLEIGLTAARQCGDQRLELMQLLALTETSMRTAEYEKAFEYAGQALSIARHINAKPLLALSLHMYGKAVLDLVRFEEAQRCYEESLLLYEKADDRRGMAEVLNDLGVLAIHMRKNDAAQDYLKQGLVLNRAIGNQEELATCLNNLGFLANRCEDYLAACEYLEQALVLFRMLEDTSGIAIALTNLGLAAYYREEYTLARTYLDQSLAAARTAGMREREITCLSRLGEVTMAQGDLLSARGYFEQSLSSDREQELSTLLPINFSNLAIIYQQLQQEDRVYPALRRALEVAYHLPTEHYRLSMLCKAAQVWILRGEAGKAATWLGLVENHASLVVKTADIKRSIRTARADCEAALSPEQFAAAWEAGKCLDLDTVVAELLSELGKD
jgi:tetratricopeptide (TPR) repeat protein